MTMSPESRAVAEAVGRAAVSREARDRVVVIARTIAASAPAKQHGSTVYAKVWWQDIHDLRLALDAAGIEWRQAP